MRLRRLLAAFLTVALTSIQQARADNSGPFSFGASVGPAAASRVDAYVTRTVGGKRITLPAAAVPALAPGDDVVVQFHDYTRPPAKVNYHVNVAFITETPPLEWLYPKSSPQDRLFSNPAGRRSETKPSGSIRFTYGGNSHRGIPVFFIVPEDGKTRGMDGVRDYVAAHPSDFKGMSTSSNDAVERYGWFRDFLASLSDGAIDPNVQQQRVIDVATALGAPQNSVSACYVGGGTSTQIANCVQGALLSVQYQTNIDAPTQAQFFGGVAGAATPLSLALYLQPILAIWKIFSSAGHKEYEYLPTTLRLTAPVMPNAQDRQLLMGLKVPTLRPPAAYSSVLFFTIGDPNAIAAPPSVVDDDKGTGVCASGARVSIPVHLDRTSQYVNDTSLVLSGQDGGSTVTLPLDPRTAATPLVDRAKLSAGHGYDVRLQGRFGFAQLAGSDRLVAHVAVPGNAAWHIQTVAYHPARAGGSLDAIASSQIAPCLSTAELQMAGNTPIPLTITRLDDRRVELTGSLATVPSGTAQIHLYQNDAAQHRRVADSVAFTVAPTPAQVDTKSQPTAFIGDREVLLNGSGFDSISALRIGTALYSKTPTSQADAACFVGVPVGDASARSGSIVTAELVPQAGGAGEAFALHLDGKRPALSTVNVTPPATAYHANDTLTIAVSSAQAALPRRFTIRLRQAPASSTPCDALRDDPTAVEVPTEDVHRQSASIAQVTLRAGDILRDDAFGTLQIQVVDTVTNRAGDWISLPGQFSQ